MCYVSGLKSYLATDGGEDLPADTAESLRSVCTAPTSLAKKKKKGKSWPVGRQRSLTRRDVRRRNDAFRSQPPAGRLLAAAGARPVPRQGEEEQRGQQHGCWEPKGKGDARSEHGACTRSLEVLPAL